MLESINIRNFKNLDGLTIESLGRVNLITGKNNTGKSSFLEALALYTSKADLVLLDEILEVRGEKITDSGRAKDYTEANLLAFTSLFSNRNNSFEKSNVIHIGPVERDLFREPSVSKEALSIRFVKYIEENLTETTQGALPRKRIIEDRANEKINPDFKIGIEVKHVDHSFLLPFEYNRSTRFIYKSRTDAPLVQFVRTKYINSNRNATLWDKITLTEKEQSVVEALNIIGPQVERITFIGDFSHTRTAVVKLVGQNSVVPLNSLGDGINRIFSIVLSLVSAEKGYLLIDEFENGFHYSVQSKIWELIFLLAEKLNVQVFSTTHSSDCIHGFQEALHKFPNVIGKMYRFDKKNEKILPVPFDKLELQSSFEMNVELR